MVESGENLSIIDFQKFYKERELGILYFPNGFMRSEFESVLGHNQVPYNISLKNLHETISRWDVNGKNIIQELGLTGIIAMGDTVEYPGYRTESYTRRNWLLGEKTFDKKIYVQPTFSEFMILTEKNPVPAKIVNKTIQGYTLCDYRIDNIQLHVRSVEQAINALEQTVSRFYKEENNLISNRDYSSLKAFSEGVPVFFNEETLKYILDTTQINTSNPRKINWQFRDKQLIGIIR
jgi:hypothetical protein